MKFYLAGPFFNDKQRRNIEYLAKDLRKFGNKVYVPMEHEVPNAWGLTNDEWARKVFEADVKAINECDEVCALTYGITDDAGTAWEIGYAYGIGKLVTVIPVNGEQYDGTNTEYSLMVYQSADGIESLTGKPIAKDTITQK